jgi:hypothetical protein
MGSIIVSPFQGGVYAQRGRSIPIIHCKPCKTPCQFSIHSNFFGPLGPQALMLSEVKWSRRFPPIRYFRFQWSWGCGGSSSNLKWLLLTHLLVFLWGAQCLWRGGWSLFGEFGWASKLRLPIGLTYLSSAFEQLGQKRPMYSWFTYLSLGVWLVHFVTLKCGPHYTPSRINIEQDLIHSYLGELLRQKFHHFATPKFMKSLCFR